MTIGRILACAVVLSIGWAMPAGASGILQFGDQDKLNTGGYGGADVTAGTSLTGVPAGTVQYATNSYGHGFPFAPTAGDFAGTDEIHTATGQTGFADGYSGYVNRVKGPATFALDYNSLVPAGHKVDSLTLGIMADDFQKPAWGRPFTATINGTVDPAITAALNTLLQTGPRAQFVSFGIDPAKLLGSHVLTLQISEGGDGADGWAVDFLTVGVQSSVAVPVPASAAMGTAALGILGAAQLVASRRRRHTFA